MKALFEADYFKRTGTNVEFVKIDNGRVYFTHSGMMFSGKCTKAGKLTTLASQKIEKI